MFEVFLGLDLSRQPSAGLRATQKRCPEKAGSVLRACNKFHGRRWLYLSAVAAGVCISMVAVLVQFSVWNGTTPNPY